MTGLIFFKRGERSMSLGFVAKRQIKVAGLLAIIGIFGTLNAYADYKDDVGYALLQWELGSALPDGAGVPVSLVEASVQVGEYRAWMPDSNNSEFSQVSITDVSGATPGVFSGHATAVGKKIFGKVTSTSPGIAEVLVYLADRWLGTDFLNLYTGGRFAYQPVPAASRVSNSSWIGSVGSGYNTDALARLDWVIATDELVATAGFTGSTTNPLVSSAFNVISVNKTSAPTNNGSASAGGVYVAGRTKPDIVAPESNPSSATARVASAAALLVDAAHSSPAWSSDPVQSSTTNRNGDVIYNAERAEVVKALLMAGADRETSNSSSTDITDYRDNVVDQTANGLDRRFGAGQLNIHSSYSIVSSGEQNSIEDAAAGAGMIQVKGFDYDPAFGGLNGTNSAATYYFSTTIGFNRLNAALVWNLEIDGGTSRNFDGSATLHDLNLRLFDVTDSGNWILLHESVSTTENTENLWYLLEAGKDYALRVDHGASQAAFDWDYGLAWQLVPYIPPLTITSDILPNGRVNQAYNYQLMASGGIPPYSWTRLEGALPPGMGLASDGMLLGSPSDNFSSPYGFTAQVTDSAGTSTAANYLLAIEDCGCVVSVCH
jgi:hypothetical protein